MQMDDCASKGASSADAALTRTYNTLLQAAVNRPGAAANIQAQERARVLYRQAFLAAMFPAKNKQLEYGSMYPMRFSQTRAWLTRQHIQALQGILDSYKGE